MPGKYASKAIMYESITITDAQTGRFLYIFWFDPSLRSVPALFLSITYLKKENILRKISNSTMKIMVFCRGDIISALQEL
jgi:hypothetical protein